MKINYDPTLKMRGVNVRELEYGKLYRDNYGIVTTVCDSHVIVFDRCNSGILIHHVSDYDGREYYPVEPDFTLTLTSKG